MKKIYLIADCGLNTNGDPIRAYDLISHAKQCGFDAVKFQMYDADRLVGDQKTKDLLEAGRFCQDWLPWIREQCDLLQIDLAVTPFYPEAVEIIKPYVDWIKIGSYEIAYLNLIEKIRESNKPVIVSTGMVRSIDDVMDAFYYLADYQIKAFLYCVSKYPCTPDDICFHEMESLKLEFPLTKIGWSDHSHDPNVVWAALMAGAEYIEMHFDIDGTGLEYNMGHVWNSAECFELIHDIRSALKCFEPTDFRPDYSKMTNQEGRRA